VSLEDADLKVFPGKDNMIIVEAETGVEEELSKSVLDDEEEQGGPDSLGIYEIGYLLAPTLAEEALAEEVSTFRAVVEKNGGLFISEEFPKMRPLAYTMTVITDTKRTKFDHAYFGWIKFEIERGRLVDIKKDLEKNHKIIRFLLVRTVRESTLSIPKISAVRRPEIGKPEMRPDSSLKSPEVKEKMTEEELDKSIEDLVIE